MRRALAAILAIVFATVAASPMGLLCGPHSQAGMHACCGQKAEIGAGCCNGATTPALISDAAQRCLEVPSAAMVAAAAIPRAFFFGPVPVIPALYPHPDPSPPSVLRI